MYRFVETYRKPDTGFLASFVIATGIYRTDLTELPEFKKATDGHFFNINTNSVEEVAKVFAEEAATTDLRQRVTSSDLGTTVNGRPQIDYSEYNVHSRAEAIATLRSFELARDYDVVVWMSAEDGLREIPENERKGCGRVYIDGRLNIYLSRKKDSEVSLLGKHIPLEIDRFETLKLGKRIIDGGGKTLGSVEEVEDLRVQPIGIKLEEGEDWLGKMREVLPEFSQFWDYIERGDDVKEEARIKEAVVEAKKKARGDNYIFQQEMAKMGRLISLLGNHGMSYQNEGVSNFKVEMRNGVYTAEAVRDRLGRLVCPLCGEEVSESTTVCPKCRIRLSRKDS